MIRSVVKQYRSFSRQRFSLWKPHPHPSHHFILQNRLTGKHVLCLHSSVETQRRNARTMLEKTIFLMTFGAALYAASSEPASNDAGPLEEDPDNMKVGIPFQEDFEETEKVMQQVEKGIEERLKSLKLSASSLSPYIVSVKGQQVSIKIPVSPLCDLWCVVVDVIARVGKLNNEKNDGKMIVSASESVVAQVLTLEHPDYQNQKTLVESARSGATVSPNGLCIGIFEPLIGEKFPSLFLWEMASTTELKALYEVKRFDGISVDFWKEIEFLKKGFYSEEELDVIVSTLRLASSEKSSAPRKHYQKQHKQNKHENSKSLFETLESMGVKVYGKESSNVLSDKDVVSWDNIAGYHEQKREVEDTILLALRCPEIYDSIARGTRRKFESNRPRAILFEGPPGTGKTSSARVIADQAGVPLLYVPLEAIMSKYYGESERALGKVFNTANDLQNGAIIFLDEIDSLATTRDNEMHEATRRMLSVLLRQIDGFEQDNKVVVIAATNRKEDLDPALISRFDSSITFGLPDQQTRQEITAQYACHLTSSELAAVAAVSEGMSGRDLRDICQQAERQWASKLIRSHISDPMPNGLPPLEEYIECAQKRRVALQTMHQRGDQYHNRTRQSPYPPSVVA